MQRPSFFLRTKLLPPRAVIDLLSRPRLTQKLQSNLNAPVTLVTADAGCGKTTLVADFIRNQPRQTVWYQLDHTDADPFTFLGYIVHGIRRIVPDFGDTILSYLEEAGDDLLRNPERAVDLLLNETLETVEQPLILVLDDYHHIGRDTIVHRLVDRLLAYSSDMLHVVITTRDLPPLAVVRRRTQGGALVITRDDLLFTDDETRDLFRNSLNIELKPEELAEYRKRTHGWATALQLIRQVAEEQAHSETSAVANVNLTDVLRQSEKDIFDYFAEEVFARETEDTQNLLLKLSLLESLPLDVCSQVFPETRTSAVLPQLVQRNVFVTVAGDAGGEVYRFHPLFRDFLLRRLRTEIGRERVAAERTQIAEFFLARRQWEQAVPYLLAAENFDRAAEVIAAEGERWLASGAILSLGIFADKIPDENLNCFPRALIYKAEVARLQGETEKAANLLRRAVRLLGEKRDAAGEAEALHSLASLARRSGDCGGSLAFLEKAETLAGEDTEIRMKCENTRGLCLIAQGTWSAAERHFRLALEAAESRGDERFIRLVSHNLGVPAGLRGDFGEALRWLRRMLGGADGNAAAQLPQEAVGHLNVARMCIYRGEFVEAESHLNKSLELCQLYNLKSLRAEVFESYGNFYRERRDFAHAGEYYERARKTYEEAGIDVLSKELDEERALLAVMRGDATTARALLERVLEFRLETRNEIGSQTARLGLCRIRLMQRETDNLAAELEEILQYFHGQNLYYYEASAAVLLAAASHAQDQRREMLQHAKRALDIAARFDYEYWLRGEIERYPTLFSDEEVAGLLPVDLRPSVEKRAEKEQEIKVPAVSSAAPAFAAVAVAPVVDLTLKVLGPVEIFRDPSKPFAPDAWTTRRARDIFCFIATSRHRRVEKDLLIDTFWGESDFEAIEKNFHPTISHIRKALNSRQTIKQNFLIYRDGAYQLNPELSYSIDTEDFDRFIAEAETAKRDGDEDKFRENLTSAHRLYRGEFMSGIYDDWAEEQRTFYREQYSRILNALAKIAFKEKDWSQTVKLAHEILREDAYREDVHRLLMRVYAAQGKRSKVKEQFESLREMLNKELGVEPAPETRRAFQELFK